MSTKRNTLRDAIKVALYVGAASIVSVGAAYAQDATPAASKDAQAKNLDTITVTGSRVRRVDTETASPVITLDHKAIEATGKLTIGEIVNDLPNINGAPLTAETNNGGGFGAATADLRGLQSKRTLVLIDGHRPGPTPVDLNTIPVGLVERIEVLTEGSSTVYGSDAIGGVINFIMRKNFNGAEYTATYGESGHHDSARKGQSVMIGQSGDKGNVVAGIEYNKFDAVPAGNRSFSKNAISLYYGSPRVGGSGSTPFGNITLTGAAAAAVDPNCTKTFTLKGNPTTPPAPGATSASDYRCFNSATDSFNYQPQNIILTPQERTNAFAMANFNVTDDITAYADFYHQKQTSQFQIAPLPITTAADGIFVSKDNLYNPFNTDFGPNNNSFRTRISGVGQRISNQSTTNDAVFVGLKGNFGQTWTWDATYDYYHVFAVSSPVGYLNAAALAPALGPSMLVGGVPTCVATPGDASTAIANCTPLNIFNEFDPQTIAVLRSAQVSPIDTFSTIQRELEFNTSGDLFDLPAGAVKLALGADQTKDYSNNRVDPIAIVTDPTTGTCATSQELCSTPLIGSFEDKEVYAELFVPLLKDVPFFYALNLDVGSRYSKYNVFKGNDSNKIALEWKPIKDLLLRGSVSDVFRAPNVSELFGAPTGGTAPFSHDLCAGLSPNPLASAAAQAGYAAHLAACGPARGTVNSQVAPGGIVDSTTASQTSGVFEGASVAGIPIQPEKGRSYDFGFVYDPDFVQGLSVSADYYRVNLKDIITALNPDVALAACFASGNTGTDLCKYVRRGAQGGLAPFTLPTLNTGTLDTSGFDLAFKYKLPVTPWGQFTIGSNFTHINKYDHNVDPTGVAGIETEHLAGRFQNGQGNFFKWRGDASLDWSKGDWNAEYRIRWVGAGNVGSADPGQQSSADACQLNTPFSHHPYCLTPVVVRIPNWFESFVSVGYNFGTIGTMDSRIDVGVDNVFDKQAPFFFTNTVTNANTDVATYDTIGRLFFARFTAKF